MEINRRDFITKVSAIAALSVLPSSFVAAMGNEKVEKAKPKYPTLKCDVVVVGAGPGGVPAAIAAARQGAKVILLEEDNMPEVLSFTPTTGAAHISVMFSSFSRS